MKGHCVVPKVTFCASGLSSTSVPSSTQFIHLFNTTMTGSEDTQELSSTHEATPPLYLDVLNLFIRILQIVAEANK
ncbi:unnamed protein product [Caenorhabditis nigoni]